MTINVENRALQHYTIIYKITIKAYNLIGLKEREKEKKREKESKSEMSLSEMAQNASRLAYARIC